MSLQRVRLRHQVSFDVDVEADVVLADSPERTPKHLAIVRVVTSEGVDLQGLLPAEEVQAIRDTCQAAVQIGQGLDGPEQCAAFSDALLRPWPVRSEHRP